LSDNTKWVIVGHDFEHWLHSHANPQLSMPVVLGVRTITTVP